ncbi:MAG: ribosomal protein S18-alanine N-acetyltransferase [Acidobacteria bacterium]|nr:ribosomal protein S18-alanine N-acetyltransferase [Acidobacteriota bacterium]
MSAAAPAPMPSSRPDGIVVAPMRPRHLQGVVALETATNPRPWSERLFRDELRMPTSRHYLVALRDHVVVGYCGLMYHPDEGHITTLSVDVAERRAAVATRLLLVQLRAAAERSLTAVTLEVRITNRPAQELYRRFGFAPGGIRRAYYRDNREDALIMWLHDLDQPAQLDRLDRIRAELPAPLVVAHEVRDPDDDGEPTTEGVLR